ncbi:unnamed protein product [Periconia digitata]|uniref:Rhodopsin domain-containing protein n=1 Tax=Periconia digitata TaxID=1303443 RepID=A0A9W4UL70_9PLEO|nr:unnamed protein product [Periconia digitata]
MAPKKDSRFLPEIWGLFAMGSLWVVMRFAVRLRTVGFYGLQIDDGFAFIALFCWAVIIAGIHCTYFTHTNIDYRPDEVWDLTPSEVRGVAWGTKFYIITLYAYITMVFSLKAIVIILYQRLACERWQKRLLHFTIFLCIAGWIAMNLMLSLLCLPYSKRFVVQPLPEPKCTASPTFFIALSCINATTDFLLLAIPVPILWTLRIPLHRRIGVFVLLASGIFVMAACITRVSLTVVPDITVSIIARWGARELSIALVAVNTAALRPMFRKSFWRRRSYTLPSHPSQDRRNKYIFNSLQRRFYRQRFASHMLNSTSAPASAAPHRFFPSIPEDSACDVATPRPAHFSTPGWRRKRFFDSFSSLRGRGARVVGIVSAGEEKQREGRDLEKGKESIVRTTSLSRGDSGGVVLSSEAVRAGRGSREQEQDDDEIRRLGVKDFGRGPG